MDTRAVSATLDGGQTWTTIPGPPAPALAVADKEVLVYKYDERQTGVSLLPQSWKDTISKVTRVNDVTSKWSLNYEQKEFFYQVEVNFPDVFVSLGKSWVAVNVKFDLDSDPDAFLDTEGWEFTIDLSEVFSEVQSATAVFIGDTARGTYVQKLIGRVLPKLTKPVKMIVKVKASIDLEGVLTQSGLVASLVLVLYSHKYRLVRTRVDGPLADGRVPNSGEPGAC